MVRKRDAELETELRHLGYRPELLPDRSATRFAAIKTRLGDTPQKLLEWIVNFAQRDLTTVGPGESRDLVDELCTFPELVYRQPFSPRPRVMPIADAELSAVQKQIHSILLTFASGGEWPFRSLLSLSLHTDPKSGRRQTRIRPFVEAQASKEMILGALVPLFTQSGVGDRLRVCPARDCGRIFMSYGKQKFCSIQHAQRRRNDESYRKRRAEELGKPKEKVKVNHRRQAKKEG